MWWFRTETLDETVERVADTFRRLAELSPLWDPWYRPYQTIAELQNPAVKLSGHSELIREELEARQREYDRSRDLGYDLRAFAGPEKGKRSEKSELYVSCCHLPPFANHNVLWVELPTVGRNAEALRNTDPLAGAVRILAEIWDPDSMMVGDLMKKIVDPPWVNGPVLGWINYLSPRVATVAALPAGWRWWEGRGDRQIFVHEGGMPSPENLDHLAAFTRLSQHISWQPAPRRSLRN
jgi:hypothetical protein